MRIALLFVFLGLSPCAYTQIWSPLGDSIDGAVLGIFDDPTTGQLIVHGAFNHVGSMQVDGVAAWDGIAWHSIASGINTSFSPVYTACRFQDALYTEGLVSPINSGHESVLRLNAGVWEGIGLVHGGVSKLKVIGDKMYALGTFDSIAGIEAYCIAAWDGINWESVGNDLNATSMFPISLSDIAEYQGDLYVVGKFDDDHGLANIAKLVNGIWESVDGGIRTWNGFGSQLLEFNGLLYVSGFFQQEEGNVSSNIMAWDATEWISPQGGVTFSMGEGGFIRSMSKDDDYIYVAGVFDAAGGLPVTDIARWDGQNWCGFDVWTNSAAGVLIHYQDKLVLAGGLYWVNDTPIPRIAQADYYVDSCGSVGITEVGMDLIDIRPFPNPTSSTTTLTWQGQTHGNCQLSLYDVHGRLLLNETFPFDRLRTGPSGQGSKQLDMSAYAKGIYFGRLVVGDPSTSSGQGFKVVKE